MRIKVDNFVIEPKDHLFDLIQLKEVKHIDKNRNKTGETSMTESIVLYNASFKNCLKQAAHLIVGSSTDTVSLGTFLDRYDNTVSRLEELAGVVTERV